MNSKKSQIFLFLVRSQNESGGTALQYKRDQPLDHSDHSYINIALNEQDDCAGLCNTENLPASFRGSKTEHMKMTKSN